MSVDAGGAAGTSGTDDGQGQAGQEQQPPEQTGSTSILEEESQAAGDEGNEGESGNQSGAGASSGLTADDVARIVESTFDRRINVVLREVRGQGGGQQGSGQAGTGQQGQQQGQQPPPPHTHAGPTKADARDAMATYREYVSDQVRFLGTEERDLGRVIATSLIAERLEKGADPEAVGREVAGEVAKQIKQIRATYEGRVVAGLRRKGLLPGEAAGSQPPPGPGKQGAASSFAAGQAKAAAMFPDRIQKQQQQ